MEWDELITKRNTNFTWSSQDVPELVIKSINREVYDNIPSKQMNMPYQIDVLNWKDPDLRNFIFANTHRNTNVSVEDDKGNPQVLAPWLYIISSRDVKEEKDELDTKDTKHVDKITYIETGVVATYIMLASENKGLATGLCECIRNRDVIAKKIGREGSKVILIIGVGIPNGKQTYFDPRVSKERNIPYRRNPYNVPNFESIFNIQ